MELENGDLSLVRITDVYSEIHRFLCTYVRTYTLFNPRVNDS